MKNLKSSARGAGSVGPAPPLSKASAQNRPASPRSLRRGRHPAAMGPKQGDVAGATACSTGPTAAPSSGVPAGSTPTGLSCESAPRSYRSDICSNGIGGPGTNPAALRVPSRVALTVTDLLKSPTLIVATRCSTGLPPGAYARPTSSRSVRGLSGARSPG